MEKIAQTGKASGEAAPQQGQASGEQPAAQAKADQAGEAVQPSKEGAPTSKASEGESITQNAWKIMEQMGVEITTEDPEAQTLDRSSPGAFYVSLVGAIQAKKSRTNAPPPTATTPMGTGSPAPVDNSKIDPIELFSRAYKKKS